MSSTVNGTLPRNIRPLIAVAVAAVGLVFAAPGTSHAAGATYYVSTVGSDGNSGNSPTSAFKTIGRCAAVAGAGDSCLIEGGTYHETVTPANSGTASAPITFAPYLGQSVTVDGADPVTGWTLYSGSIYRASATLPVSGETSDVNNTVTAGAVSANQVFVDGSMTAEAQYPAPSGDISHPATATEATGSSDAVVLDPNLPSVNLTGALEHVVSTTGWTATVNVVSSSSAGQINLTTHCFDPNCNGVGAKYYLTGGTNGLALLTAPGEWWYDWTNHYLYLRTAGSDSPASHTVEAKARNYAFDLSGRSYVDLTGLNIRSATVLTSSTSSHNTLNAISAYYVSHSLTLPNDPQDPNSCGIWCSNITDTGIILDGVGETLENSIVSGSAGNGVAIVGTGETVTNNLISDVDYLGGYASGVDFSFHGTGTVSHNTIYNSGRFLVGLNPGVAYANQDTISHNNLYDYGIQTRDLGAVYVCCAEVAGQSTSIDHNWVHDSLVADHYSQGVMLDDGASGFVVHHNVVWNTGKYGIKLNASGSTGGASSNDVYNNTIAPGVGYSDGGFVTDATGTVIENNLWAHGSPVFEGSLPNATVAYNSSNTERPQFVDPAVNDYRLQSDSPAHNAGTPISGITDGYTGTAPDQGAYEYGGADWIAGCGLAACTAGTTGYLGIQAAAHTGQSGTSLEPSSAGGQDVDFIYNGTWTSYGSVDLSSGAATLTLQTASPRATPGTVEARLDSPTGTLLATCTVPDTGGWQTYTTVSCPVTAASGVHTVYLVYKNGASSSPLFNLDWFRFGTAAVTTLDPYQKLPATQYDAASGVGLEYSSGGGFQTDVSSVQNGYWTAYANVAFGSTGPSAVTAQVASATSGGSLQIRLDSATGTLAGSCAVPGTGGWQNYNTVNCAVSGITGTHSLYLVYAGGSGFLFNLDWFQFS